MSAGKNGKDLLRQQTLGYGFRMPATINLPWHLMHCKPQCKAQLCCPFDHKAGPRPWPLARQNNSPAFHCSGCSIRPACQKPRLPADACACEPAKLPVLWLHTASQCLRLRCQQLRQVTQQGVGPLSAKHRTQQGAAQNLVNPATLAPGCLQFPCCMAKRPQSKPRQQRWGSCGFADGLQTSGGRSTF